MNTSRTLRQVSWRKLAIATSGFFLVAGVALGLSQLARAATPEDGLRELLQKRIPQLGKIDEVAKSPIPGLYEIRVNGSDIYYADAKGEYIINGSVMETKSLRNLTEERVNKLTAIAFDKLPFKDAFTIVRGNGKRKIAIFEDPNCGYCRRFERDLQKIDNVTVYLFLYPILGADSGEKSKAIWCARDKGQAWQDWMLNEVPVGTAAAMCDTSPVARNVEFGRVNRISGTPTMFFQDGTRVPGAIGGAQIEKYLSQASKG